MAQKQDTRKKSQPAGLLYPVDKSWNQSGLWKGFQKICCAVLLAESRVENGGNIFSKNKEDRNAPVLVVQRKRANYWTFIHKMPQMEKSKKEVSQRTRKGENQIANPRQKKMASKPTSKQKNSSTTA